MGRTGTSSTAWVAPFALGAATSLSILWISNLLSKNKASTSTSSDDGGRRSTSHSSYSTTTTTAATKSTKNSALTSVSSSESQTAAMDAPDLDNRVLRKAETVLQWRTSRLILIIERCTNDHNYSAILRTAEALGIQYVWTVEPPMPDSPDTGTSSLDSRKKPVHRTEEELQAKAMHHLFAQNATDWLSIRDFATSQECVAAARAEGYALWVTDLSQEAESLTATTPTIPDKVALVMGTEAVGCSQHMLDSADKRVYLPLRGFADSLNLSVATALVVHQLFVMDPTLIGAMDEQQKQDLRKDWYVRLASQRILTSSQKKHRHKLNMQLRSCQTIRDRNMRQPHIKLQTAEKLKLENEARYQQELNELEALVAPERIQTAIQEFLDNPPPPLVDVRRPDIHRVTYVGKSTKKLHSDDWKDMAATSKLQTQQGATATFLRDKLGSSAATEPSSPATKTME